GALTAKIDRMLPPGDPEMRDYEKAAPFRKLASKIGEDPATLAHRYALGMQGVDTLVLGVKNREELRAAVAAAARGPLEDEIRRRIDALRLNFQIPRIPIDGEGTL
ncbi:MAG: aldo/keto reductase, partial [Parvibaculum sp.]